MKHATASLVGGVGLMERAVGYTLGALQLVTPAAMGRPSPCRAWDLYALLQHMNDSLTALHEAVDLGHVDVAARDYGDPSASPVTTLRNRACDMLGAWAAVDDREWVSVGGCPVSSSVVTATGALEITVHGWDVARACGLPRPIPAALGEELLPLARLLVTGTDRPGRFAAALAVPPMAAPGVQLLAFLGRRP